MQNLQIVSKLFQFCSACNHILNNSRYFRMTPKSCENASVQTTVVKVKTELKYFKCEIPNHAIFRFSIPNWPDVIQTLCPNLFAAPTVHSSFRSSFTFLSSGCSAPLPCQDCAKMLGAIRNMNGGRESRSQRRKRRKHHRRHWHSRYPPTLCTLCASFLLSHSCHKST